MIIWSLGNEAGTGQNLKRMADWVGERDPVRPVQYKGDHICAYTDIYSRMYPDYSRDRGHRSDLVRSLPRLIRGRRAGPQQALADVWYADAMGNGPGGIDIYEQIWPSAIPVSTAASSGSGVIMDC